jgi:hypothetical protein
MTPGWTTGALAGRRSIRLPCSMPKYLCISAQRVRFSTDTEPEIRGMNFSTGPACGLEVEGQQ